MRTFIFCATLWLMCGFFAWGVALADIRFEHKDYVTGDCRHDQAFMAIWGEVGGPISLGWSLALSGFAEHGVQWTCNAEVKR